MSNYRIGLWSNFPFCFCWVELSRGIRRRWNDFSSPKKFHTEQTSFLLQYVTVTN